MQKTAPQQPQSADVGDRRDRTRAIVLMCLGVTAFSGLDATAKYLVSVSQLPATEVVWLRFLAQFLVIFLVVGAANLPRLLKTRRLKQQMARSFLMLAATICNFLALKELRLDQTMSIQFVAPLIVALLAGPLLGEWVGWRRLVAILVGFTGMLVMIRPGFVAFQPELLLALCTLACYALVMLLTRYLAQHDAAEVTLVYSLIAGTCFMTPFALVDWVWPADGFTWLLLASTGLWGAIGHYLFILAYRYAPAPTVAPFVYVQLVSMTTIGFLVFGDVPDRWTLAGAAIIIASGIYLVHRERLVKTASPTLSPR
jgi:drug/metabolite transporter (DMT)-like permease